MSLQAQLSSKLSEEHRETNTISQERRNNNNRFLYERLCFCVNLKDEKNED